MSICPRVGALAKCLDRARLTSFYQDSKRHVRELLSRIPLVGNMATPAWSADQPPAIPRAGPARASTSA